jgi:hypothetical protein
MMTEPKPNLGPAPSTETMTVTELDTLARAGGPWRGKAVFALIDRVPGDTAAVDALGELAKLPVLRNDRIHMVTLAWAAITGLLAGETPRSRALAYSAFAELGEREQEDFLRSLKASSIEEAHPAKP